MSKKKQENISEEKDVVFAPRLKFTKKDFRKFKIYAASVDMSMAGIVEEIITRFINRIDKIDF